MLTPAASKATAASHSAMWFGLRKVAAGRPGCPLHAWNKAIPPWSAAPTSRIGAMRCKADRPTRAASRAAPAQQAASTHCSHAE